MSNSDNTLFLRLSGPMQSWGTSSRFQLRRTDAFPSKSGLLGLLLCAKGIRREDSSQGLEALAPMMMGVRVDRAGSFNWDYHTAGAKIGIRSADGKIKKTATTGEFETLLSRRQYLIDASFLVALHGSPTVIEDCVRALENPTWPVFLGRKCCVPSEPVFAGVGTFESVLEALASKPWQPRIRKIDCDDDKRTRTVEVIVEHPSGTPPPNDARLVYDVPAAFGYFSHRARWVTSSWITVPVGAATHAFTAGHPRYDPYGDGWDDLRRARLEIDGYLCVFCKMPAVDVHHTDYENVRPETLRSLCKVCHDACTTLEYSGDLANKRIDPADPEQRPLILRQIERSLNDRRFSRRRELLEAGRTLGADFFGDALDSPQREGR